MNYTPSFNRKTYPNVRNRSACLVKKGLMRAMITSSVLADPWNYEGKLELLA